MLIYENYLEDLLEGSSVMQNISSIIALIGLIAMCKIYSDCGKSWWKALIPFYNIYVFGEIVGDEEKGSKAVWFSVGNVVSSILMLVFLISAIVLESDTALALSLVVGIAGFVFWILYIIKILQLRSEFLMIAGLASWINAAWFFFPAFVQIYLAFFAQRGNQPNQEYYN